MVRRSLLVLVVGLATLIGVAGPAHAVLVPGSWTSPASGAHVSATVTLDFSTSGTDVTFTVPQGQLEATVSDGEATAAWSTSRLRNGPVQISAHECDLTGCDDVAESVTVDNPVPVLSAASPLSQGSPVQVSSTTGAPSSPAQSPGPVMVRLSYASTTDPGLSHPDTVATLTPPGAVSIPSDFASGTWTVSARARFQCDPADTGQCPDTTTATYTLVVPAVSTPVPAPRLTVIKAAKTFHPFRDGVGDEISATVSLDTVGRARMVVSKNHHVVKRGGYVPVTYAGQVVIVSSGRGLKPGHYSYVVEGVASSGMKAATPRRSVTGDAKKLVSVATVLDRVPRQVAGQDVSGRCSSATLSGSSIALRSNDRCQGSQADDDSDVASAVFFPGLKSAAAYGTITLSVTTSGKVDALLVFQGGQNTIVRGRNKLTGVTVVSLPGRVLSPASHQLQFVIGNVGGHRGTITHIRIEYVRRLLR